MRFATLFAGIPFALCSATPTTQPESLLIESTTGQPDATTQPESLIIESTTGQPDAEALKEESNAERESDILLEGNFPADESEISGETVAKIDSEVLTFSASPDGIEVAQQIPEGQAEFATASSSASAEIDIEEKLLSFLAIAETTEEPATSTTTVEPHVEVAESLETTTVAPKPRVVPVYCIGFVFRKPKRMWTPCVQGSGYLRTNFSRPYHCH